MSMLLSTLESNLTDPAYIQSQLLLNYPSYCNSSLSFYNYSGARQRPSFHRPLPWTLRRHSTRPASAPFPSAFGDRPVSRLAQHTTPRLTSQSDLPLGPLTRTVPYRIYDNIYCAGFYTVPEYTAYDAHHLWVHTFFAQRTYARTCQVRPHKPHTPHPTTPRRRTFRPLPPLRSASARVILTLRCCARSGPLQVEPVSNPNGNATFPFAAVFPYPVNCTAAFVAKANAYVYLAENTEARRTD